MSSKVKMPRSFSTVRVIVATALMSLFFAGCGLVLGNNEAPPIKPGGDTTAPSQPKNLLATAIGTTQINLSWTASSDNARVVGYRVSRDSVQIAAVTTTSYSNTGLSPNTEYSFTVAAVDGAGNVSIDSAAASATTSAAQVDTTAPSVPTGLTATAISSASIDLTWTASTDNAGGSGLVGYHVYRDAALIGTATGTTYSDSGLTPVTLYSYSVDAYDNSGNASAQSVAASATTAAAQVDTTAPSVPTGLTATATSSASIDLTWTASTDNAGGSGLVGYHVYRDAALIGTATGTTYSDSGLTPVTLYSYSVDAYDNSGNASAQSVAVVATTLAAGDTTAPSVPTGLTATVLGTTSIDLAWTASTDDTNGSGLAGYTVYRDGFTIGVATGTTYSDSGLVPATEYNYRVAAYDNDGNASAQCPQVRARTDAIVAFGWDIVTVDSTDDVGAFISMALGSGDKAHISYNDGTNADLKYATNASGTWIVDPTPVDSTGNMGYWTSCAADSSGNANISYYDGTNFDLKFATNASGIWETEIVDSGGNVGKYTSLALSGAQAHISYYDLSNGDLKYATNVSGTWVCQTVDSTGDVGLYTSLALDGGGKVHISYHDAGNTALKYATNASGTWVSEIVDNTGNMGLFTSLALDNGGKAHISYNDGNSHDLKYATNASGAWVLEIVDFANKVGAYTSLALDNGGKAHISYQNYTTYDLQYATNASGTWVFETVDTVANVGYYTSLALDNGGKVHIAYRDGTNADLRYAKQR